MELLLLLSAFLTALTGAITGVRPVQAAAQEQVVARQARVAVAVKAVAARPVQGWPALALDPAVAARPFAAVFDLAGFGMRRRE